MPTLLINGEAGIGKSALLANWIQTLNSHESGKAILYYFLNPGSVEKDVKVMISYIIMELTRKIDNVKVNSSIMSHEEEDHKMNKLLEMESFERNQEFKSLLFEASKKGLNTIIVIDGIDKIDYEKKIVKALYWIPDDIPSEVKIILSTRSSDSVSYNELVEKRQYQNQVIDTLDEDEQRKMCKEVLMTRGKELSEEQLKLIVEVHQTSSPLFLRILLEELCSFGKFRELNNKIRELTACESVTTLFDKFLERLENDYNMKEYIGNVVEKVLSTIYVSQHGLTEDELRSIHKIPNHVWIPLFYGMEMFLIDRSGRIGISTDELKDAIYKRYIRSAENLKKLREQNGDFFMDIVNKETDANTLDETSKANYISSACWHYAHAQSSEKLKNIIMDLDYFVIMAKHFKYDLLEYVQGENLSGYEIAQHLLLKIEIKMTDIYIEEESALLKPNPIIMVMDYWMTMVEFLEFAHFSQALESMLLKIKSTLENNNRLGWKNNKVEEYLLNIKIKLAALYIEVRLNDKAKHLFEEIIDSYEKKEILSDDEKHNLAKMYHGAGTAYVNENDFEKAEALFEKSIEIHNSLPQLDPKFEFRNTAKWMITKIYYSTDRQKLAVSELERILQHTEELYFGELPPKLAYCLTDLGIACRKMKDFDKAKDAYERALDIKLKSYGENHFDVAVAHVNLANYYADIENYEVSEMHHKKALQIFEAVGEGETIPAYRERETLMSVILRQDTGREKELEKMYWKLFDFYEENEMFDSCLVLVHSKMASYYNILKDWEKVEKICVQCCNTTDGRSASVLHFMLLAQMDKDIPEKLSQTRPYNQTVERGLELFPNCPPLYASKAFLCAKKKDLIGVDEALTGFYKNPNSNSENLILDTVSIMEEINWQDGARKTCETWHTRREDFVDILWKLVQLYNGDDNEKALEYACKHHAKIPDDCTVMIHLIRLAIVCKKWPLAQQNLKELTTKWGESNAEVETWVKKFKEAMESEGHPFIED